MVVLLDRCLPPGDGAGSRSTPRNRELASFGVPGEGSPIRFHDASEHDIEWDARFDVMEREDSPSAAPSAGDEQAHGREHHGGVLLRNGLGCRQLQVEGRCGLSEEPLTIPRI